MAWRASRTAHRLASVALSVNDHRGRPNRHLRGLRLDAPVEDGDAIALGERQVGAVGTAVLSPALGPIALAVVRREAEPGSRVAVGEGGVGGEVIELPF